MSTSTSVLASKNVSKADEVRDFPHGKMAIVKIGGFTFGRATFQPGWRWSTSVKPIAGTASCEVSHVGYIISGRMKVVMDHGQEAEAGPGDFVQIGPGHDAWIVGNEPCEYIEVSGAPEYAKGHKH
jgi:mannose-6-phosphate isomerase-like protein (cupin superfamily)